ncbi:MAG: DUF2953 domain-containing protein [Agathobacter sp.]
MIPVLWVIIKIILWVILILLSLLLISVCFAIFSPVRYRFWVVANHRQQYLTVRGSYLAHLIRYTFRYDDGEITYDIRLLWFSLKPKMKHEKDTEIEKEKEEENKAHPGNMTKQAKKEEREVSEPLSGQSVERSSIEETSEPRREKRDRKNWKEVIKNGVNTWKQGVHKIQEIKRLTTSEMGKRALNDLLLYVRKLFQHLLPRKSECELTFGFEDPALTGQCLAVFGMLLPLHKNRCRIRPNFQESVFLFSGKGRGRIQLSYVLYLLVMGYMNKNLMSYFKRMKKLLGGNENEQ